MPKPIDDGLPMESATGDDAKLDARSTAEEQIGDELLRQAFGDRLPQAQQYQQMLASRGVEWGLIGPRESDRLWSRHILNCVAIQTLIGSGMSVLDVGSGAGLPGIPLALARPDLKVTLLDSLLRRTQFLQLAIDELGLAGQVAVVRGRAEETAGLYDVVVARAVAPLSKLVRWCAPLTSGSILALKGEKAEQELLEADKVFRDLGMVGSVQRLATGPGFPDAAVVIIKRS